jgi:hypothetical protein
MEERPPGLNEDKILFTHKMRDRYPTISIAYANIAFIKELLWTPN